MSPSLSKSIKFVLNPKGFCVNTILDKDSSFTFCIFSNLSAGKFSLVIHNVLENDEVIEKHRQEMLSNFELSHRSFQIEALRHGADVLGVQVESVRCAAVGEEAVEFLAQQTPRLAHDGGVVGADRRHLCWAAVGHDCVCEQLGLKFAVHRSLLRLNIAQKNWLGCRQDEVEDVALLHA